MLIVLSKKLNNHTPGLGRVHDGSLYPRWENSFDIISDISRSQRFSAFIMYLFPAAWGASIAAICVAATSRTSINGRHMCSNTGISPDNSFLTVCRDVEYPVASVKGGPITTDGWTVTSSNFLSFSSFSTKSHAAFSAKILLFSYGGKGVSSAQSSSVYNCPTFPCNPPDIAARELVKTTRLIVFTSEQALKTFKVTSTAGTIRSFSFVGIELGRGEATWYTQEHPFTAVVQEWESLSSASISSRGCLASGTRLYSGLTLSSFFKVLTVPRTLTWPFASNCLTMCVAMKPDAPVTRTRGGRLLHVSI